MIKLGLEELGERRKKKIVGLVEDILDGQSHPYFEDFFKNSNLGQLKPGFYGYNHKRFSYYGLQIFKETRSNWSRETAVYIIGPVPQTKASSHAFVLQSTDMSFKEDYKVKAARVVKAG